jgi:hypothetical protein
MSLITINKNPPKKDLNTFGLLLPGFTLILAALFYWRTGSARGPRYILAVGLALTAVYWLIPPLKRYVYLAFNYAAFPIGYVVSHVILAATYYLVITPIGLLMRLLGRDPMQRTFDRAAPTYWLPRVQSQNPATYFRQF